MQNKKTDHSPETTSYHSTVDYSVADPAKVFAQQEGLATALNMPFGFEEVEGTRGESAYVFDMGDMYGALVQEGLGTKSLIAQSIYRDTGVSYFAAIAQDTVATFINDLISVGATPVVSNAYWSSSSYQWLEDNRLTRDFISGWRVACDAARVVWGGGETQALSGIIQDGALELAGSAFGVIKEKKRLVSEKRLQPGDAILLIESSGIHANGASLARQIAEKLPHGYQTVMDNGRSFGEGLLEPTHLYTGVLEALFDADLSVHYLSNITGHGWRKIMRATAPFAYTIQELPDVPEVFNFIAKHSGDDAREMYGNYNMGAGYAVYLPQGQAARAQEIIRNSGLKCWVAGQVTSGDKKVVIEPLKITYASDSLALR